jgi:EmrB/QacA subfamily drug resistance transporter
VTPKQRFTLIAAILGSTVVFLDSTVVNVALPAISEDLDAGLAGQQWVVEAYMLTLVALMLVGGSLGDQFGRRRLFIIGLAGFAATSALCAIAPSDEFLVGARGLQGIAGALLVPGSLALVASSFEGPARGKAVGTWTAWTGIATVLGPAGGGWMVDQLDWRWIFWVNLPLVAVTIWLTVRHVQESRDPEAWMGIDWGGIALSALGLAGPVFALIEQPTRGWEDPLVWAPLLAGVACFALFLLRESRAEHPMLDLALFRIRNFWVVNLTTFTVYGGLIGGLFFIPLYLQQIAGYSALESGLATTPISILLFVLSPRFGRIASDTGPRVPMCVGPIVAGLGMMLLLRVGPDGNYLGDVLPGVLLFALGLAATVAPLTATVLDSVQERHAGIASGVNNGISRVAGLLTIAILGAVISGVFGSALDDQLRGTPLSPAAARSVDDAKRQPLGAPDTGGLGGAEANRIDAAGADASTDAFHLGLAIAALLMIAGGVVAGLGIVNPRPREVPVPPRAATAGECGRSGADPCPSPVPGDLGPPIGAGVGSPDTPL